jgi:3-oxoadipate enol-lactonase
VLLHGLSVDADLNWFVCYGPLAKRHRVIAMDHRGHGRGIRSPAPFRLADCADDVAAVLDALGIDRAVMVGYSMGGPIAQLTWHRHRERVAGLVLCATAAGFVRPPARRVASAMGPGLSMVTRLVPRTRPDNPIVRQLLRTRMTDPGLRQWVMARQRRTDVRMVLQAAAALARFSSRAWLGEVDVPTSAVVTQFDRLVPRANQEAMANAIPGATMHHVLGDHAVCVTRPDLFLPALHAALHDVMRSRS